MEILLVILVVVALFWGATKIASVGVSPEERFVKQVLQTNNSARRKNFIVLFNEAKAFRYFSHAGTNHYFTPAGRVRLVDVRYFWVPWEGAVPAIRQRQEYQIQVRRVLTGELFSIPVKDLEICGLEEALTDNATDDARKGASK